MSFLICVLNVLSEDEEQRNKKPHITVNCDMGAFWVDLSLLSGYFSQNNVFHN